MNRAQFATWLDTLIEEKGINTEHIFTIQTDGFWQNHIIPLAVVIEIIKDNISDEERQQILHTLVKIDFINGDIMHFFNYLAAGIAANYESREHV